MSTRLLSIILPCYNPPAGWEDNIVVQYNLITSSVITPVQLIVVCDGVSGGVTQASLDILKNGIQNFQYIDYPLNQGKGYAIRQGVAKAEGDIIIYTDIDFPYTLASFLNVYSKLANDTCDVAFGIKNSSYDSHVPFIRRVISRILKFIIRIFLSIPVTDTQCGLKGFNRKVVPLFLKTTIDRYLFDLEFVRNGYRSPENYRMLPVEIALNDQVQFRKMNYRILLHEMFNFLGLLSKRPL